MKHETIQQAQFEAMRYTGTGSIGGGSHVSLLNKDCAITFIQGDSPHGFLFIGGDLKLVASLVYQELIKNKSWGPFIISEYGIVRQKDYHYEFVNDHNLVYELLAEMNRPDQLKAWYERL